MGGMEHEVAIPSCLLGLCLSEHALLAVLCTRPSARQRPWCR